MWRSAAIQIVSVHVRVKAPAANWMIQNLAKKFGEPLGERHAAALNAYERKVFAGFISLHDFVRDASQRAMDG